MLIIFSIYFTKDTYPLRKRYKIYIIIIHEFYIPVLIYCVIITFTKRGYYIFFRELMLRQNFMNWLPTKFDMGKLGRTRIDREMQMIVQHNKMWEAKRIPDTIRQRNPLPPHQISWHQMHLHNNIIQDVESLMLMLVLIVVINV